MRGGGPDAVQVLLMLTVQQTTTTRESRSARASTHPLPERASTSHGRSVSSTACRQQARRLVVDQKAVRQPGSDLHFLRAGELGIPGSQNCCPAGRRAQPRTLPCRGPRRSPYYPPALDPFLSLPPSKALDPRCARTCGRAGQRHLPRFPAPSPRRDLHRLPFPAAILTPDTVPPLGRELDCRSKKKKDQIRPPLHQPAGGGLPRKQVPPPPLSCFI